jgi:hypothetical protein
MGTLGCVDHNAGGKILYVFDGGADKVLAWNDVSKVYAAAPTAPTADRTITSSLLSAMGTPLAWGGMAVDSNSDRLYLLTEGGVVYVIAKASTQNGAISATTDITSFSLTAGLSSAVFGPVAVDTSTNTLYITENSADGQQTRVWTVPGASQIANGASLSSASQTFSSNSDTWGLGLAVAPGGTLYGLFGGGSTLYDNTGTAYSGPRLRQGSSAAFTPASAHVLIGSNTGLNAPCNYSSLAYDPQNAVLYAMPQPGGSTTQSAVLVFTKSQFSLSPPFNQAPRSSPALADTQATLSNLRTISHPIDSDWLLGADFSVISGSSYRGTGLSYFYIWNAPSAGGSASKISATGASEVRAVVVGGGSNS